jgi:hypothetical protein
VTVVKRTFSLAEVKWGLLILISSATGTHQAG